MLNWYRASRMVVPPPGVTAPLPDWLLRAFPKVRVPTLVVWGMKDPLLPCATRRARRSAARLAAVQALYQQEMEEIPVARLLHEFHQHRLGATIDGVEYAEAEVDFFDDLVSGRRRPPRGAGRAHRRQAQRRLVAGPARQADEGDPARRRL